MWSYMLNNTRNAKWQKDYAKKKKIAYQRTWCDKSMKSPGTERANRQTIRRTIGNTRKAKR